MYHGPSLGVLDVGVVDLVEVLLLVDAGRPSLREHRHGHVDAVVELLDQVAAYEVAGAVEAVRAVNPDEFGWVRAHKRLHDAQKQVFVIVRRGFAVPDRVQGLAVGYRPRLKLGKILPAAFDLDVLDPQLLDLLVGVVEPVGVGEVDD